MSELRIKELARERHVTMAEVARAAGYRQTSSLNQKMSRKGLTTDQMDAIADLLGVETPDLFARTSHTLTCPNCGATIKIEVKG